MGYRNNLIYGCVEKWVVYPYSTRRSTGTSMFRYTQVGICVGQTMILSEKNAIHEMIEATLWGHGT